jgi:hypothetical protein
VSTTISGQWCLDLVAEERRGLLERIRRATTYTQGFQSPTTIAASLGLRVVYLSSVPGGVPYLTDGRTVLALHDMDRRVRGTTAFIGVASAVLALQRADRTTAAVQALAARLAAPPVLMSQLGLDETIRRQEWATERFLLRCWHSMRPGDDDRGG